MRRGASRRPRWADSEGIPLGIFLVGRSIEGIIGDRVDHQLVRQFRTAPVTRYQRDNRRQVATCAITTNSDARRIAVETVGFLRHPASSCVTIPRRCRVLVLWGQAMQPQSVPGCSRKTGPNWCKRQRPSRLPTRKRRAGRRHGSPFLISWTRHRQMEAVSCAHPISLPGKFTHSPHSQRFPAWLAAPDHEWYCDGVLCLSADVCRTATFDAPLTFVALSTGEVEACHVF